jgi:hypothetical protein
MQLAKLRYCWRCYVVWQPRVLIRTLILIHLSPNDCWGIRSSMRRLRHFDQSLTMNGDVF